VNWEALAVIGGGSILLLSAVLIPLVLYWRHRDAKLTDVERKPTLTPLGMFLLLIPVALLLVGAIIDVAYLGQMDSSWHLVVRVIYVCLVLGGFARFNEYLEKRGSRFQRANDERRGA
jgi:hydrogenase-4 membrane subunit HyfE